MDKKYRIYKNGILTNEFALIELLKEWITKSEKIRINRSIKKRRQLTILAWNKYLKDNG